MNCTIQIPGKNGPVICEVANNRPIFILGPNGTGKSALVHRMRTLIPGGTVYIPGSRTVHFDSTSLNMTPMSRKQYEINSAGWDSNPETRWKPISGSQRAEKSIHDLQSAEVQYKIDAANRIIIDDDVDGVVEKLKLRNSPLDNANQIFSQSNLPVQFSIADGEVTCSHGGKNYSIAQMSDGERSALIIMSDVVAAKSGTTFIIDEPELHLHRSIVVPLLHSLISRRPDCSFVVCTHEIDLPSEFLNARIILVRGCEWAGNYVSWWDVDVLDDHQHIPEDLRVDIYSSRKKILFIEGMSGSLDSPLYAILYPNVSIRDKGGCEQVRRAVVGLKSTEAFHRTLPFGLVDNDAMTEEFINSLRLDGVYALPIFSVESLYYSRPVRRALAIRQAAGLGLDHNELADKSDAAALKEVSRSTSMEHLAARLSERAVRQQIARATPSRAEIVAAAGTAISVSIASPYTEIMNRLSALVDTDDIDEIIARYPVRETGALEAIRVALKFQSLEDYESAARVAVKSDDALRLALKAMLGPLDGMLTA